MAFDTELRQTSFLPVNRTLYFSGLAVILLAFNFREALQRIY